jgi:hypothetical protein
MKTFIIFVFLGVNSCIAFSFAWLYLCLWLTSWQFPITFQHKLLQGHISLQYFSWRYISGIFFSSALIAFTSTAQLTSQVYASSSPRSWVIPAVLDTLCLAFFLAFIIWCGNYSPTTAWKRFMEHFYFWHFEYLGITLFYPHEWLLV